MKLILSLVSDRVLPDRDYPAQSASFHAHPFEPASFALPHCLGGLTIHAGEKALTGLAAFAKVCP
jgi:hypothetical protein